jgi:DNA-binding NtrC family response regulator
MGTAVAVESAPPVAPSPAIAADWPVRTADGDLYGLAPSLRLTDTGGAVLPLDEIERETVRFAIAHYRGQMSEVARRLKIGRSTLYRKLEGLGLEESERVSN